MPTLTSELTAGFSDGLTSALEGPRSEWTPEGEGHFLDAVALLRRFVAAIQGRSQAVLRRGADARAVADESRRTIPLLDRCLAGYARLEENGALASASDAVGAAFTALREDVAACRSRLAAALAKAEAPRPALDWRRLKEESDADFAAGRSVAYDTAEQMAADLAGDA